MISGKKIKELIGRIQMGEQLRNLSLEVKTHERKLRLQLLRFGLDYRKVIKERRSKVSEALFKKCLQLAKTKGSVPLIKEFKMLGIPMTKTGWFTTKLLSMGYKRKKFNAHYISNELLLSELIEITKKIMRLPEHQDILKYSRHSAGTFKNHFGSMKNIHVLLNSEITAQSILPYAGKFIEALSKKIEAEIDATNTDKKKRYAKSKDRVQRITDQWHAGAIVMKIAEAENLSKEYIRKILKEEGVFREVKKIRKELKQKKDFETALSKTIELNRIPNVSEMTELGIPVLLQHEIRLKLKQQKFKAAAQTNNIPASELIDELKRIQKIVNRTPALNDISKFGRFSPYFYFKCFGSLRAAQTQAGLKPNKPGALKGNKNFLKRKSFYKKLSLTKALHPPESENSVDYF